MQRFSRYLDVDGDGIAARTLPGTSPKGGYFTRGSGHTKHATYTEDAAEYQEVVDRLTRKFETAAKTVPGPEMHLHSGNGASAPIGLISLGGCHAAVLEAVDRLRAGGLSVDYMRVRAFPFAASIRAFLEAHPRCYVVEQNRDGQLRTLLAIETGLARDSMIVDPRLRRIAIDRGSCRSGRRGRRAGARRVAAHIRRSIDRDQKPSADMTSITKPPVRHPSLPKNALGLTTTRLRGRDVDAVRRVRPRLRHRRAGPGAVGARPATPPRREDERHRLLVEDDRVLPEAVARLQRRARSHAGARDAARTRRTGISRTSASLATATRCRSDSASFATRSAAT